MSSEQKNKQGGVAKSSPKQWSAEWWQEQRDAAARAERRQAALARWEAERATYKPAALDNKTPKDSAKLQLPFLAELFKAVSAGDCDEVRRLFSFNPNQVDATFLDAIDQDGKTLWDHAFASDSFGMPDLLLDIRAQLKQFTFLGTLSINHPPLYKMAEDLKKQGIDIPRALWQQHVDIWRNFNDLQKIAHFQNRILQFAKIFEKDPLKIVFSCQLLLLADLPVEIIKPHVHSYEGKLFFGLGGEWDNRHSIPLYYIAFTSPLETLRNFINPSLETLGPDDVIDVGRNLIGYAAQGGQVATVQYLAEAVGKAHAATDDFSSEPDSPFSLHEQWRRYLLQTAITSAAKHNQFKFIVQIADATHFTEEELQSRHGRGKILDIIKNARQMMALPGSPNEDKLAKKGDGAAPPDNKDGPAAGQAANPASGLNVPRPGGFFTLDPKSNAAGVKSPLDAAGAAPPR